MNLTDLRLLPEEKLRLQAGCCSGQDGGSGARCGQLAEEGQRPSHFGRADANGVHLCCVIRILGLGWHLLVSLLFTRLVQSPPLCSPAPNTD